MKSQDLVLHIEQHIYKMDQDLILMVKLKEEYNLLSFQMKNQKCHLMLVKLKQHKLLPANLMNKIMIYPTAK